MDNSYSYFSSCIHNIISFGGIKDFSGSSGNYQELIVGGNDYIMLECGQVWRPAIFVKNNLLLFLCVSLTTPSAIFTRPSVCSSLLQIEFSLTSIFFLYLPLWAL